MASPERHVMILSVITMGLSSIVSRSVPIFSGKTIDLSIGGVEKEEERASSFRLLINLLGLSTVSGFFGFFRILWQARAGHRLVARLRRKLYAAILSQDAAYFDTVPPGDPISRLGSDANLVRSAVTDHTLGLIRQSLLTIGAVTLLF